MFSSQIHSFRRRIKLTYSVKFYWSSQNFNNIRKLVFILCIKMLKLLVSYFLFKYDAHWWFCRLNKLRPLKMNDGPTPRRTKSSFSFTLNQKKITISSIILSVTESCPMLGSWKEMLLGQQSWRGASGCALVSFNINHSSSLEYFSILSANFSNLRYTSNQGI